MLEGKELNELRNKYISEGKYKELSSIYEKAIELNSDEITHYLYLGLAYLLKGNEEEAQTTWLYSISQGHPEEVETWTKSLLNILEIEAQNQLADKNLEQSWLICQHIQNIDPNNFNNLFNLIFLSIELGLFEPSQLSDWDAIEILTSSNSIQSSEQFYEVLKKILDFPNPLVVDFSRICLSLALDKSKVITIIMSAALKADQAYLIPQYSAELTEACLKESPNNFDVFNQLPRFYMRSKNYQKAITAAEGFRNICQTLQEKILGNSLLLKAYLCAGEWSNVTPIAEEFKSQISTLIAHAPDDLSLPLIQFLISNNSLFLYLDDSLQDNRIRQNQVSSLFQKNIDKLFPQRFKHPTLKQKGTSPIRIGYIAHTLTKHSVGWLSRWLFKYHNHDDFHLSLYLINLNENDPFLQTWLAENVDQMHVCGTDPLQVAEQIHRDNIDILVDLDSTTLDFTCTVMALKPAPIQVTWLGWDASGLPTVDYYVADRHVIPEEFNSYYQEKIWRLPSTYIAVDGFETDIPSISRKSLDIPADSIVYFTAQTGFKRHPDIAKLQIEILAQVPNSYLLIKGLADGEIIKQAFNELAIAKNVSPERLKFLPIVASEATHRANIGIADIALDTYPYNGATTTIETLWMEVPIVTRVGEQLSARNSHAFMQNAGIVEGIAYTNAEYVEWGVKLGTDESLRQQIVWKLKQSKHTAPLWNAKQFTLDMENAYRQMWKNYIEEV